MRAAAALLISLLFSATVAFAAPALDLRYILVDVTHPSWAALQVSLQARVDVIRPGNKLSVPMSDDGTQAVVKVLGFAGIAGLDSHPAVLEIHTDNEWAKILFRTDPDWSRMITFE